MKNRPVYSVICIALVFMVVGCNGLFGQMRDDDVERNLKLAQKYLSEGNHRLALHYAEQVRAISPGNLDARELIERVNSMNRAAENSNGFTDTKITFPDEAVSGENLLLSQWQNGEPDSEERKKAGADLAALYLEKAQALEKSKADKVEVLLYLRKASILNPENGWVQYELFKILSDSGRAEESLTYGRKFLELVGFGVVASDVKRKLVHLLVATGDKYSSRSCWDKATTFYREVEKYDPSDEQREDAFQKLVIALKTLFFQLHGKEMYVETVPYLNQLFDLRPKEDPARSEYDRKHFWRIRKFAPDVYWAAIKRLRKRGDYGDALNCIHRLLNSGPSSGLKKKALEMKELLLQDQVAANADNTIGLTETEEPGSTATASGAQ